MKIVYVAAGAGDMYCGSCLHGNTLAKSLLEAGQDVLLVSAYTPVRTDEESVGIERIVFGGVNVYLQQLSGIFRHTPWFFDRLLDWPALLRRLGRRSASVRPEKLGPMTLSMLQGEEGRQAKELAKLLDWLQKEVRPDVVHLSNVLLVGMAREIRRQLNVPVVCTLAGEDIFLEKIPPPYYEQARNELRQRCGELAALVTLSDYYADFMANYLAIDRNRITVIRPGLQLTGHAIPQEDRKEHADNKAPSLLSASDAESNDPPDFTLGYLARICHEKGLHLLIEAFILLANDSQLPPLRLCAAGYLGAGDRAYFEQCLKRLDKAGVADRFEYIGQPDRKGKIAFLQSLDVMSMPTVYKECKGLTVLEAWANGIPVVQPAHGAFPELIEATQGGLLCEPNNPRALADALRQLIQNRSHARQLGSQAQQVVHSHYHAARMASDTLKLYRNIQPLS